jgi:hypothetical protein
MNLVVYLLSSLYSTPVCTFRLMSYGKFILFSYIFIILYFKLFIFSVSTEHDFTFYREYNRNYVCTATTWSHTASTFMMFFVIHILYCHNMISHCWHILRCSFCIHILYCHSPCIYLLYDVIVFRLVSYHIEGSGSTKKYSRSLRMALFCWNT